jgi:peptidoglycan/xylan/chitin deacetylase (PgdA/CDA1 family)
MLSAILRAARHEVGVHGWIHEFWPGIGDAAKGAADARQGHRLPGKATGTRRRESAPSSGFSPQTFDLIRKAGFLYDSSLLAADEPYEIVSNGQPSGVIELPIAEVSNDYVYYGETANGALPSPDAVFRSTRPSSISPTRNGRCSS